MSLTIVLKVVPSSGKQRWALDKSMIMKCYLKSPPEDGKANRELIAVLAKVCKVPQVEVDIIHGLTSRKKVITINTTLTQQDFMRRVGLDEQLPIIGK